MPTIIGYDRSSEASVNRANKRIVRSYRLELLIAADSASDSEDTILNTPGVPRIGIDAHPSNPFAICKRRRARRSETRSTFWRVIAEYDTDFQDGDKNEDEEGDPLDLTPDIEWNGEELTMYRLADLDDKKFVNSAGTPFEGGLAVTTIIPTVVVQRWEADFSYTNISTYSGKTNSSAWNGVAANRALMGPIRAKPQIMRGFQLWQVTYTIKIMEDLPEKWKVRMLNAGPKYLDGSSNLTNFVDNENQPTTGLLDSDGTELAAMDDPTYEDFRVFDEVDFTPLNLVL